MCTFYACRCLGSTFVQIPWSAMICDVGFRGVKRNASQQVLQIAIRTAGFIFSSISLLRRLSAVKPPESEPVFVPEDGLNLSHFAGEMIVGPMKVLFMDEISTGLDSSTTFSIVKSLRRFTHELSATVLISLLQPAPETFNLFDDVLLLSEGQVVYHGPIGHVAEFFESCGFKSPERKGIADFLQEVK